MRKALGRGLEALLPGPSGTSPVPMDRTTVPVRQIVPNPEQPRRHFDAGALASLAGSIRRHGLLQPLVVRRTGDVYELIAGERRWRAALEAGIEEVPVLLREASPGERLELALIENIQRENLSPLEEAEAFRHLMDRHGLTQEALAERVGKSRPAVANALRLLGLPDAIKSQLESGELTAGHARAVLSVGGPEEQIDFARDLTTRKVSKSEAERLAATRRSRRIAGAGAMGTDLDLRVLVEDITRALGTRVRVTRRARGGTIEIEFYSDAELERLTGRLLADFRARA